MAEVAGQQRWKGCWIAEVVRRCSATFLQDFVLKRAGSLEGPLLPNPGRHPSCESHKSGTRNLGYGRPRSESSGLECAVESPARGEAVRLQDRL